MAWVRIDDAFNDHPKFAAAGPLGIAQWLAGLAYSNRNLTDGFIPRAVAKRLLDWEGVAWNMWQGELVGGGDDAEAIDVSERLVDVGLWHHTEGGYLVHDYHDFQPSSESVKQEREKARERMTKVRSARSSPPRSPSGSDGVRANTTENVGGSSSYPVPVPVPKSKSKTPSSADADAAFEEFWKPYPRKVGKQDARKVWDRKVRQTAPAEIVAGLRRYLPTWAESDQEFIPHPSTWLQRGSWEDELSTTKAESPEERMLRESREKRAAS